MTKPLNIELQKLALDARLEGDRDLEEEIGNIMVRMWETNPPEVIKKARIKAYELLNRPI